MAELEYGEVRGRYLLVQANVSRPAEGTVTFTPIEPDETVDVAARTLITREKVEATFDGDGAIHAVGSQVDYLPLAAGRWEVSFRGAAGLTIRAFQFDVTAGDVVNLPAIAPIQPSPAVKFVVNELVYTQTLEARDETFDARDVAVQAAEDAVAPTNEVVDARIAVTRGQANGVGSLGSNGRQPAGEVATHLTPEALSTTIAASGNVPTSYTWDSATGFIATIVERHPAPVGNRTTTYSDYGAYGPTREVDPAGTAWTLTYDANGNPIGREVAA